MEALTKNWLWVMIVLPVLAGFFKAELGKLLTAWRVYRLRSFDVDGNPSTSDEVQLYNEAQGKWDGTITIEKYQFWANTKRYCFWTSARTRGVYLQYPDGGRERVPLLKWAGMRKRTPPPHPGRAAR